MSKSNTFDNRWHHLLKEKFLDEKHNRCINHLLHCLFEEVMPYLQSRHRRQAFGFEGPDLKTQKRIELQEQALRIPIEDTEEVIPGKLIL